MVALLWRAPSSKPRSSDVHAGEARRRPGVTALIAAAVNGRGDVVTLLIAENADVDARGNSGAGPRVARPPRGRAAKHTMLDIAKVVFLAPAVAKG